MTWRCSTCGLNWPYNRAYETCKRCGGQCWSVSGSEPMAQKTADDLEKKLREDDEAEKHRLKQHADFEHWYTEREAAQLREALDHWAA